MRGWQAWGRLVASRPAAVLLFALVWTGIAGVGLARIELDEVPRNLLRAADADYATLDRLYQTFGSDDSELLVLVRAGDLFSPRARRGLYEFVRRARSLPGIGSVVSLYDAADFEWDPRVGVLRSVPVVPPGDGDDTPWTKARERLARDPAVSPVPVSADGSATLVSVRLEDSVAGVAELRPVLDRLAALSRTIADASGLQIRMTGVPAIRRELYDLVRREALVFGLVGTGLIVLVSLALFASLSEACVGAVPPLLATGWTVGLLGLLGEPLNVVNVVVPVLIIVIGYTNALHLHLGIRRAERQGASPGEAVIDALARIGPACALAAITTAIGFASLAAAKSDVIRHFGLVCAAGALAAMLATVTVTPALCLVVPRGRARRQGPPLAPMLEGLVDRVLRHRKRVAVAGVVLTGLLATTLALLRPDFQLTESMPRRSAVRQTLADVEATFGGIQPVSVMVEWSPALALHSETVLDALRAVQQTIGADPALARPASLLTLIGRLPRRAERESAWAQWLARHGGHGLSGLVRTDLRRALVRTQMANLPSSETRAIVRRLRAQLDPIAADHPGVRLELTGTAVVMAERAGQFLRDLTTSLISAAGLILVIIAVTFRSWRVALLSAIPNLFPLVVISGALVVSGLPMQLASVTIFTACLGLAVDDTLHVLHRYRLQPLSSPVEDSLKRSVTGVGLAMVSSTLVLSAGFATLMLSDIPTSRTFGSLACLGMLAALAGDLILLPALAGVLPGGLPARSPRSRGR